MNDTRTNCAPECVRGWHVEGCPNGAGHPVRTVRIPEPWPSVPVGEWRTCDQHGPTVRAGWRSGARCPPAGTCESGCTGLEATDARWWA